MAMIMEIPSAAIAMCSAPVRSITTSAISRDVLSCSAMYARLSGLERAA